MRNWKLKNNFRTKKIELKLSEGTYAEALQYMNPDEILSFILEEGIMQLEYKLDQLYNRSYNSHKGDL